MFEDVTNKSRIEFHSCELRRTGWSAETSVHSSVSNNIVRLKLVNKWISQ